MPINLGHWEQVQLKLIDDFVDVFDHLNEGAGHQDIGN